MPEGISIMPTTKVERPKEIRSSTLSIKVFPSLKEALDEAAEDDGRSTSQFVERILTSYLQDKGRWPK